VKWNSPYLPVPAQRPVILHEVPARVVRDGETSSVLLVAVQEAGIQHLPGFLNACIIFCVISASNTALYVSSRTLFGLARGLDPNGQWPICWLAKLGTTTPNTRVPAWALVVSALAFFWLPFLHLNLSYSLQNVSCNTPT
jgi:yeast amino acid transporter